jgi:hypothetical protein
VAATLVPDLEEYRRDARALLDRPGAAADERFAHLFSAEAVAGLRAAAEASGAPGPRALARFAAEGHLRSAAAREVGEIAARLREPVVEGPWGALAPADVDAALAAEPDRGRRAELQAARLKTLEGRLAGPIEDARARWGEAARAAGAASPEAFLAGAAGIDLAGVARDGAALLDATDDDAARALDRAAREALGAGLAELDAADLPRLVRAPQLEPELPPEGARPAVLRTAELLGADPRGVPAPPASGLAGLALYAESLRAAGSALAAAGASPRLPVEAGPLADPAGPRAAGLLLEGLVGEPAWLARVAGVRDTDATARAAAAVRLLGARVAAARAAALADGPSAELLSRAVGLPFPEPLALGDRLAGLGPADDLRARALAAALRAHLREGFGERWFADPRAGDLLREIWLEGGTLDPEGLARELGAPGLDPGPVAAEATERRG